MHSHFPVRPQLVSTSSAMSSSRLRSQYSRSLGKKSSGGMTEPAQPWIGSSTKPATSPTVAFAMYSS